MKLLLIDDEEPARKIVGMSLRSDGYEVLTAEDGKSGLELFEKEAEPFGSEVIIISTETREGVQLRDLGKIAAILRYEVHQ